MSAVRCLTDTRRTPCEDIDNALEEAKRLGGEVITEPYRIPGLAFALIADPSGSVVRLAQQP
ncbi:MAG TPA: hypothetical protein VHX15_20320 [Frankiaceae bacterium]|nr:hypothetical protein [Frankiaceae bacterium]